LRDHDFHLEVAYALTSCQLIEQELKLYTSEAFQLAAKCVGHRMVFKFSRDDYEDASLERLIAKRLQPRDWARIFCLPRPDQRGRVAH
jgi:hypothetical protein